MAITYRSDTGTLRADNATGAQTISFVTTQPSAGDLVVAGGVFYPSASSTLLVSDNQGNTYNVPDVVRSVLGATAFPTADPYVALAHDENVASSGTFTLSFDTQTANSYYVCGGVAFSQAATASALDVTAAANTVNTSQNSQATGTTASTAQADAVSVIVFGYSGADDLTPIAASGFTVTASSADPSGGIGALAYRIETTIAAKSGTWTFGGTPDASDDYAALIAVYKGAGASPTPLQEQEWYPMDVHASPTIVSVW